MTGESEPVRKEKGGFVYAGTVVEEGELTIEVKAVSGSTRYEKIVTMIEDSEKLKSAVEGRAEHLADRLVPYTFLGTGLTWLLTRNVTRTLSVLMVDFSCALKLAMPLTVLTAIREANAAKITVKGGKYLLSHSVRKRKTIFCVWQHVWRSIFLIRWQRRLCAQRQSVIWNMRKYIPRWNISLHMALPLMLGKSVW